MTKPVLLRLFCMQGEVEGVIYLLFWGVGVRAGVGYVTTEGLEKTVTLVKLT